MDLQALAMTISRVFGKSEKEHGPLRADEKKNEVGLVHLNVSY